MTYFDGKGTDYTQETLNLARERIETLNLRKALVATTTGQTAALAASRLRNCELIAVTHSTGFRAPDTQELLFEHKVVIESAGGTILTVQHAMGGINRAIRRKMDTFQPDEIIANTLRIFGQGMKVVFEICLMAADAGLVHTDELVMCIAGSGRGADTAVVMKPANAQDFFDLQVIEVVCLPSPNHSDFQEA
jgi:hypothetical protein